MEEIELSQKFKSWTNIVKITSQQYVVLYFSLVTLPTQRHAKKTIRMKDDNDCDIMQSRGWGMQSLCSLCLPASVTRLGDFLHFGQLFKACGNNYFAQIAHILGKFCRGLIIFHFSSGIVFGQLL